MDAIKNLANQAKGASGTGSNAESLGTGNSALGGLMGKEDYVDKGLDAVEKKTGMQQNRMVNERITDEGRGMFEKATGTKVPAKISN